MADITSVQLARQVGANLERSSPDLLRAMLQTFAEALMGAEADAICGAPYGQVSEDRVNYRNGYRERRWDTRTGTIELAIPKLRQSSYFPDWLLTRRRRAEQALISVVATSYLPGVSTRRVEKLAETLGITSLPAVAGIRAGQKPGRRGGGIPVPAARWRPRTGSCRPARRPSRSARAAAQ